MDLERLRRETSHDHQLVEEAVPLMKAGLTQPEYVACLQRLYGLIWAWEETNLRRSPEWLQPLQATCRRRHLLQRDLEWFGVFTPAGNHPVLPPVDDEAALLGAMYVMEGSKLGGQLISRHVEKVLGLEGGRGNAFFRGNGPETGALWKEFCEVLRTRVPENRSGDVIRSAQAMFRVFGEWMQDKPAQKADDLNNEQRHAFAESQR